MHTVFRPTFLTSLNQQRFLFMMARYSLYMFPCQADFVLGCMIVELFDYRPQRNKASSAERPERTRVVLHPNSETLWADICSLNVKHGGKWTDQDALEIEAKILVCSLDSLVVDHAYRLLDGDCASPLSRPRSTSHPHREPYFSSHSPDCAQLSQAQGSCTRSRGR